MTGEREGVQVTTSSDGTVLVRNQRGSARLRRISAGVCLMTCAGVLSSDFYPPMVAVAQREIDAAGTLALLVDGWDLRSIDTAFREAWTEWFKMHRQTFRMQLLVRSKLMDMAASLANLFTGISVIKSHSSITAWERACAEHAPGFQRLVKSTA